MSRSAAVNVLSAPAKSPAACRAIPPSASHHQVVARHAVATWTAASNAWCSIRYRTRVWRCEEPDARLTDPGGLLRGGIEAAFVPVAHSPDALVAPVACERGLPR